MPSSRSRIPSLIAALVAVASLSAAAAPHHTPSPAAAARLAEAQDLFEQHRYRAAIAALEEGYAIERDPRFLYTLGQAHRMNGNHAAALAAYERFLGTAPSARLRAVAEQNIRRCQTALAAAAIDREVPPAEMIPPVREVRRASAPVAAPAAAVARSSPPARPKPLHRRWWVWTAAGVVVAGGIALGAGLGARRGDEFKGSIPDLGPAAHSALKVSF